jgi:predicted MFS family arabinose efflux permease
MSTITQKQGSASGSFRKHRLAVRLAFLVAGFGIACWAPLVPFAQQRLAVDAGVLGALLLCLGLGSVTAMVLTGMLCNRYGTSTVILISGLGMAFMLPWLTVLAMPWTLGLALMFFGAFLGTLDVAMNINAVEVERQDQQPLMSGFHGMFSIGGFLGAAWMTVLLSAGINPWWATVWGSVLMTIALLMSTRHFLQTATSPSGPLMVMPRGIVVLISALAAVIFLIEGTMLDWSALLITQTHLVSPEQGGIGYMLFAIAMTFGRFTGDAIVTRLGDRSTLVIGGLIAVAGIVLLLVASDRTSALAGFVLIGLGASNLVPILFRRAGQQSEMPAAFAVSAVTTAGYAGILLGPALVGFAAKVASLPTAFGVLAGLLVLVPLSANRVANSR